MKNAATNRTFRAPIALILALSLLAAAGSALANVIPKILKKVPVDFPAEAVRRGVDKGVLKAQLTVDGTGAVTEVAITDTQPAKAKVLNRSVSEALMGWKFEGSGKPASFELQIVMTAD